MHLPPDLTDIGIKLVLAIFLAGLLGLERQRKGRSAGLRTHIVVCLGSTLAMIISSLLAQEWAAQSSTVGYDRSRIAAGILQGIGFIGAGAIINNGSIHRGLTTAAMVWFVGVLGIAIGLGYYFLAVCATLLTLGAVLILERVAERVVSASTEFSMSIRLPGGISRIRDIEKFIVKQGYRVHASRLDFSGKAVSSEMTFDIGSRRSTHVEDLIEALQKEFDVIEQISVER